MAIGASCACFVITRGYVLLHFHCRQRDRLNLANQTALRLRRQGVLSLRRERCLARAKWDKWFLSSFKTPGKNRAPLGKINNPTRLYVQCNRLLRLAPNRRNRQATARTIPSFRQKLGAQGATLQRATLGV